MELACSGRCALDFIITNSAVKSNTVLYCKARYSHSWTFLLYKYASCFNHCLLSRQRFGQLKPEFIWF